MNDMEAPFLLLLASCVTAGLMAERVTFACVCLLLHVFTRGPDGKSTWFVSSLVQTLTGCAGSMASATLRLASFSVQGVLLLALVLMVWALLLICAQFYAEGLVAFQTQYNSSIGGVLRMALIIPARLVQLLWDATIPLYNLVMYCSTTIPMRVLLEDVLRDMHNFEQAALNLALFIRALMQSLVAYVGVIVDPPDSFDPNLRLLDLITPLAYWRLAVSHILAWMGNVCAVASSLGDAVAYPFLDINLGLGVHNLVNAALTLVIQTPLTTLRRCWAGGGAVVYCLPDFEPTVELAVLGVRQLGYMGDNWLDVITIIVQAVLTDTSPACEGWLAVADTFGQGGYGGALLGLNESVIVGVDDHHFAKTDGWNVEVHSRTGVQRFPSAFPAQMNVNYGVAVVGVTAEVRGLMGCACTDQNYGMQVVCAVAPLDALTPAFYVPVEFDVPTTSFFMGCGKAKIRLDSIRWPVTRSTSPNSDATVRPPTAQAALYVRPMCSSEWTDVACVGTFKLSGCFPYCMALWTKGAVGSMVLRGAEEWLNTVSMGQRDCGLHSWDLLSGELSAVTDRLRQNSGVKSTWMDAEVQLNSSRCVYASNTFSRLLKSDAPAYAAYRSVLLADQPFAFAGDLVLTAVNTVGTTWGIHVQRIYGNQANEFTLVDVNKFIPAVRPCETPSSCTIAANSCGSGQCRVAVPYSFDSTPWANVPAVATDRYVFWITNPSMNMYQSINHVCRQLSTGALAFEVESSYSSIQVWRMDPYEFCPIDPATGVRRCPEDTSATFRTLPGFVSMNNNMRVCTETFLVVAPVLTYVNRLNLALTVLNTTFANVDTDTLRPINASLARSATAALASARDEPARLKVHAHVGRGEDLPAFLLHAKVADDHIDHLVEPMHAVEPARGEGADVREALLEARLVADVCGGDLQHPIARPIGDGRPLAEGSRDEGVGVARHVAHDELDLIGGEASHRLQLARERHGRDFVSAAVFFWWCRVSVASFIWFSFGCVRPAPGQMRVTGLPLRHGLLISP